MHSLFEIMIVTSPGVGGFQNQSGFPEESVGVHASLSSKGFDNDWVKLDASEMQFGFVFLGGF